MMEFETAWQRIQRRQRFHLNPGNRVHITYSPRFDDDGVLQLVPVGKEDIYDQIQSHADSCDINLIVQRYAMGDQTVLSQRNGVFMDAVGLPTSYADLLNIINDGERAFDALPIDVRRQFDFDFGKWIAAGGKLPADEPSAPAAPSDSPSSEVSE